jgi:site-specific DNA recombinase
MPNRAAIYCRISRDTQGTGLGVARQESDCRAFCESRGWNVAEVLTDNDVSAYSRKRRPAYERLIDGIEAGEFDALVIWHPDRLHRHPAELESFIDVVENTNITIGTVTAGDWDLSTEDGLFRARIIGAVARKESGDKSRRLRRKHKELAEAGKVSGGGRRPFGFEPDKLTLREVEAVEIRSAVRRVIAGESLRSVSVDWNTRSVPTVTGVHWSPTTVRRLLQSARIAGMREHDGKLTDAVWPAIVPWDDVLRVRARLASPTSPTGRTPRRYLLTGVLLCGRCGSRLTTRPVMRKGHRYARYVCSADRGGCGRLGVSGERLDEFAVELLFHALDTPEMATELATPEPTPDTVSPLRELEARSVELAEMFAAGEISRAEWAAARDALQARVVAANEEMNNASLSAATASLVGSGASLRERWPDLSLGQRRAVVDAVIESITIAPTTRAGNKFDPDRVAVSWRV